MSVLTALHTDKGIVKETNQDAVLLKVANSSFGEIVFAVVCDGMGGLSKGELASATVVKAFSDWFEQGFVEILKANQLQQIEVEWNRMLNELNSKISDYGNQHGIKLGTTFTGMLVIGDDYMLIGQVGDSRAYEVGEQLIQLTEDQTLVQREVNMKRITPEQAKVDPRQNVLLQCLGASKVLKPVFIKIKPSRNHSYFVCSDGLRHKLETFELYTHLKPENFMNEQQLQNKCFELVEQVKQRKERDNISIVLIKLA
jgi:PPM family protein phosphatase